MVRDALETSTTLPALYGGARPAPGPAQDFGAVWDGRYILNHPPPVAGPHFPTCRYNL